MVTANVDNLTDSFEGIIEDRDVVGAATLGLAGAGGGVIATQVAGRVAPVLGLSSQPTDLQGLFTNGLIKMLVGAGLGFLALQVGGTPGVVLGVAALGGLILGGGDWINAVLATEAGVPGASTTRARSGNASARVVSSTTSRTTHNGMDENRTEFRAADTGRGGTPERESQFR